MAIETADMKANINPVNSTWESGIPDVFTEMYLMGHANSGFTTTGEESWFYIDELKIYGQNPEW